MYDIEYQDGFIKSVVGEIVNVRNPFHKRIDLRKRRASARALMHSPDQTRKSPQVLRYVVPTSPNYCHSLHVTYKNDLKCQAIYDTTTDTNRVNRSKILKRLMMDIDKYPQLKSDLTRVINLVLKSWDFDCIITDIPWIKDTFEVPVINGGDWLLNGVEETSSRTKVASLLIRQYGGLPMNLLSFEDLESTSLNQTNIPPIHYNCPLILMRANAFYTGWLSNKLDRGLPVILFKIN